MNICSPKDGFVLKLLVSEGDQVKVGAPLLQMDSDTEDKDAQRVHALESIRQIRAKQFNGPELKLLQDIAQTAVDLAREKVQLDKIDHARAQTTEKLGTTESYVTTVAQSSLREAQLTLDRATAQQSQLQFAVARHTQIDVISKQMNDNNLAFISKRKSLLSISAPAAGSVHLHVSNGSFAELGSVLLEIG